jgi:hypothetical protein
MMIRQIVASLIVVLATLAFAPAGFASGSADSSALSKLISQNEDARMTAEDLAFFLATHNYDATPKDGFVQVKIDDTIYKLVPNGVAPGLADMSIII